METVKETTNDKSQTLDVVDENINKAIESKSISNMIDALSKTDIRAAFIEIGFGSMVSPQLCINDATKKNVVTGISPNDEKMINQMYGLDGDESDEKKVEKILLTSFMESAKKSSININTIFVSIFRENKGIVSGWVGMYAAGKFTYYHLTSPSKAGTDLEKQRIVKTGLLMSCLSILLLQNKKCKVDVPLSIDQAYDLIPMDIQKDQWAYKVRWDMLLRYNDETMFVVEGKDGIVLNYNEWNNQNDNPGQLIIFKGSFDPPHKGHVDVVEVANESFPGAVPLFMISLSHTEGKKITFDEVKKRCEWIVNLGYPVIVTQKGSFRDNLSLLKKRSKQSIIFPIGTDVFTEFVENIKGFGQPNMHQYKSDFCGEGGCTFVHVVQPDYELTEEQEANNKHISQMPNFFARNHSSEEYNNCSSSYIRDVLSKKDSATDQEIKKAKDMVPKEIHNLIFKPKK